MRRVNSYFTALRNVIASNKRAILITIGVTALYFSLIFSYSEGALYIGADDGGYYSLGQAFANFSIYEIFFPFAYIFSAGNIYLTFNVQLFLNMLLTFTSIYFLTHEFFKGFFEKEKLILIETAAVFIYPLNIASINVVWDTLFNSFQPPLAFLILFVAITIRIARNLLAHEEIKIRTLFVGGAFLGLAAEIPYPNTLRIIIIGLTIISYLTLTSSLRAIFVYRQSFRSYRISRGLVYFSVFISTVFIFSLYCIWPVIENLHYYFINSIQLSATYTSLMYGSSPINVFQNTIRLTYGNLDKLRLFEKYKATWI